MTVNGSESDFGSVKPGETELGASLEPDAELSELAQRGWQRLAQINAEAGAEVLEQMQAIAPDLGRYILEFAFGEIYSRPGLDAKTRQLVTITALTTLGNAQPQLKAHIHGALNLGCTRTEVVEVILQLVVYAGFPAALNAMLIAKQVFAERDEEGLS
ncbi:carboxymuconolactone decarboxylase family protein [Leptolyngbya sp. NK1-12]|uniref:Carboxymuconolactone decarboxylase family protein n=1 Tax=Leptolyngbya sp. NK1-12 TaxID=2547451 RepID=A0AA96WWS3_9CYAN|nr:carboxymuconolactone decarboxylase family protein [Leptolyngbya sp. NK1-12]WNZ25482.1 carboxymuconolactone decarboxylase family protein [Leptolyngbya sp. NK1-12]